LVGCLLRKRFFDSKKKYLKVIFQLIFFVENYTNKEREIGVSCGVDFFIFLNILFSIFGDEN